MAEPGATGRARSLRRRMPLTERVLWPLLRDRRLEGLKFRRQVPLAGYVVDFACFSARLR
jgi:very-short-patch-repair endonuclease